ncbi:MAG: LysR-family transcriptional regulator, partial [Marmoricola sp.]|nr:LysR-family transcriptional regulator [Marmoricola sp.]
GSAHVGFVEGVDPPAGVASEVVATDELVLVAAPGSALTRRRGALEPAEVAELALTSREQGSGTREVVERALAAHGFAGAAPVAELTTATAQRQSVVAGSAPAFLSRRVVERDLASGELVLVPTRDLVLVRSFRAVWSGPGAPPAGPVRDLVGLARQDGRRPPRPSPRPSPRPAGRVRG